MCFGFTCHKRINKHNIFFNLKGFIIVFAVLFFIFAFFNKTTNNKKCYAEDILEHEESVVEELNGTTNDILNGLDFDKLDELVESIDVDFSLFGGDTFKGYVKKIIEGEEFVSVGGLFDILLSGARESLKESIYPFLLILVIVLFFNMFKGLKSNKISRVGEVIYFICFAFVSIILIEMSGGVIYKVNNSFNLIKKQMGAIFPLLLSLMSVMGGVVSVNAYTPMFAFLTNTVSNIFAYVLYPLFLAGFVLTIVGFVFGSSRFDKLNGFISSSFKWVIGVTFAVYMSFLAINGLTAGGADGISIKATKYAIKNYVPMLGGYISDGFQLVKAGGLLVKNATGVTGVVLLIATIFSPIISLSIMELGLKLTAGVVEVLGDKKCSGLLYGVGKSFKMLTVVLVGISLMYFFAIFLSLCSVSNFL